MDRLETPEDFQATSARCRWTMPSRQPTRAVVVLCNAGGATAKAGSHAMLGDGSEMYRDSKQKAFLISHIALHLNIRVGGRV